MNHDQSGGKVHASGTHGKSGRPRSVRRSFADRCSPGFLTGGAVERIGILVSAFSCSCGPRDLVGCSGDEMCSVDIYSAPGRFSVHCQTRWGRV
ncbi:unnamed protein product [Calypogeia fissa]